MQKAPRNDNFTIRKLALKDIDSCAQIIEDTELFQQYHFTKEAAVSVFEGALTSDSSDFRVIEIDQEVLGFAWVIKKGGFDRASYLRLIAIAPKATGQKLGALLLDAMEETHLLPYGFFLLVTASNSDARRFYEKRGYLFLGAIPGFVKPGIDECIYYKVPK